MTRAAPITRFAGEKTAAQYVDMKLSEFLERVQAGDFPGPNAWGRYDLRRIDAIMTGQNMTGLESVEW